MSIEVILREHVEHLGDRGEVVKVANGYARNFLLPRKLALVVTEENKKQIERERVVAEAREKDERNAAEALAQKLTGVEIAIARRVGENQVLFGSVTASDIAEALAALQFTVSLLSDGTYQDEFLSNLRATLRTAFAVRAVYLAAVHADPAVLDEQT